MQSVRRALLSILIVSFAVISLPVFAQQVIATVPVGSNPYSAPAVNSMTNKIYVTNACGNDTTCAYPNSQGTVTVIDGTTNNTLSVNVGYFPIGVAVDPVTNKIYVANDCGNDSSCASDGTVTVIDGVSNTVIGTVTVGSGSYAVAVNSVTNMIYVTNYCGNDVTCRTYSGTVTVIDGATLTTATVNVGANPFAAVVNSVTNKIYVPNGCGSDPTCAYPYSPGTVTVIDGATNNTVSVNVGVYPTALDVNSATNKIYVANNCGNDPNCGSTATMTVIDGTSLVTTDVAIGGYSPSSIAVNSSTNKIYVPSNCYGDTSCHNAPNGTVSVIDGGILAYTSVPSGLDSYSMAVNSVTNKAYVANSCISCQSLDGTVTVIDDATVAFTNIGVGSHPYGLALNSVTNRIYVPNSCGNDPSCNSYSGTVSVIDGTPPTALQFVAVTPCRVSTTRQGVTATNCRAVGGVPSITETVPL